MSIKEILKGKALTWVFVLIVLSFVPIFAGRYIVVLGNNILIYAIIIVGFNLIFGYVGQCSFAANAFFGIGAYVAAGLTTRFYDFPFIVGMISATVATGLVGYLIGFPCLKVKGFYLAMVTLAFAEICSILFVQLRGLTGGADGYSGLPSASIAGYSFDTPVSFYYFILVLFIICAVAAQNLIDSKIGRAMRSMQVSELGAIAAGVKIAKYKTMAFAIHAAYAGLAGACFVHYSHFVSPELFNLMMAIEVLVMSMVGGVTSIGGALIGAAVLRIVPELGILPYQWYFVIYGLIIMLVMIFLPKGLLPGILEVIRYRRNPLRLPEQFRLVRRFSPITEPKGR